MEAPNSCHLIVRIVITLALMTERTRAKDIRLVNGHSSREGRVEVYNDGVWGTFCGTSFESNPQVAEVICRSIGYPGAAFIFTNSSLFGAGDGPVYYNGRVTCTGDESSLSACNFTTFPDITQCQHDMDAGVICHHPGYAGCFDKDYILLDRFTSVTYVNTSRACRESCFSVSARYSYVSEKSCLCGDTPIVKGKSSKTEGEDCNLVCSGDQHELCGGSTAYAAYLTEASFCPRLGVLENGIVDGVPATLDDFATVYCDAGFGLTGDADVRCIFNDSQLLWETPLPLCTRPGTDFHPYVYAAVGVIVLVMMIVSAICFARRQCSPSSAGSTSGTRGADSSGTKASPPTTSARGTSNRARLDTPVESSRENTLNNVICFQGRINSVVEGHSFDDNIHVTTTHDYCSIRSTVQNARKNKPATDGKGRRVNRRAGHKIPKPAPATMQKTQSRRRANRDTPPNYVDESDQSKVSSSGNQSPEYIDMIGEPFTGPHKDNSMETYDKSFPVNLTHLAHNYLQKKKEEVMLREEERDDSYQNDPQYVNEAPSAN